jgi:hypothetical protein
LEHFTQIVTVVQATGLSCEKVFVKEVPYLAIIGSITLIWGEGVEQIRVLVFCHELKLFTLEPGCSSIIEEVCKVLISRRVVDGHAIAFFYLTRSLQHPVAYQPLSSAVEEVFAVEEVSAVQDISCDEASIGESRAHDRAHSSDEENF